MFEIKKLAFVVPVFLFFSNSIVMNNFHHKNNDRRRMVVLNTQANYGSNAITTGFTNAFLTGSFIDDAMKNSVRDKLQDYNRIGMDWNTELYYANLHDTLLGKNWGYYLGIKNRLYVDGSFQPDAFNLAFYGNKPFAGQTADLSYTSAKLVMYQQFEVGFIKQWLPGDDRHTLGFGMAFINGNLNYSLESQEMTLYTDPDGEYIDLDADLTLQRTNSAYSGFMANNGSGLGIDLFYEGSIDGKGTVSLSVNDLGFISWERGADELRVDSMIHFEGIAIDNIATTDGSEFSNFVDSLGQYAVTRNDRKQGLMMLPSSLHLAYTHAFVNGRVVVQGGIQVKAMNSHLPFVYARGIFYPHRSIMLGAMFGYGGFGTVNFGLDLGFDFGKGYGLMVNTRNIEGVIPNSFATSMSAGLKFSKQF